MNRESSFNTYWLERIEIADCISIDSQVAKDMTIDAREDFVNKRLHYVLQTLIYRHKVDEAKIEVPFEKTEAVHNPIWPLVIAQAFMVIAMAVALAAHLVSPVDLIFATGIYFSTVLWALIVPRKTEVTVRGTVEVQATYWHAFPDNTIRFDPKLGPAVRMIDYGEPRFIWAEDPPKPEWFEPKPRQEEE